MSESYYIVNTNRVNSTNLASENLMLTEGKAATHGPAAERVKVLEMGDVVFLYASGMGIVAWGTASGAVEECRLRFPDYGVLEGYCMALRDFRVLAAPVPPREARRVAGYRFPLTSTLFRVRAEAGVRLVEYLRGLAGE